MMEEEKRQEERYLTDEERDMTEERCSFLDNPIPYLKDAWQMRVPIIGGTWAEESDKT